MIRRLIKAIVIKMINWCMVDETTHGDIFNSIRINALVTELSDKGLIDSREYETCVEKIVYKILKEQMG